MEHLYKNLFNFNITSNMRISSTNNEIYNQLLLYIFFSINKDLIILTSNLNEATKLYNDLKNYQENVFLFPEDDYLTKKAIASSPELLFMRLKFLNNININDRKILICHFNSFIKKLPSLNLYNSKKIKIKVGDVIKKESLIDKLIEVGYNKESIVTNVSEFASRGFVLDIFPIEEEHPIRIEYFDNTIESIRFFDETSQLSLEKIDKYTINPIIDHFNEEFVSILDYLNEPYVIMQDINQINNIKKIFLEQLNYYKEDKDNYIVFDEKNIKNKIYIDLIDNKGSYDEIIEAKEIPYYNENIDTFLSDLKRYNKSYLYTKNKKLIEKILEEKIKIKIINEYINKGFIYKDIYYYSDNDLKTKTIFYHDKYFYKEGKKLTSITNLKIGDYVVHKVSGIGIYKGIKTITKNGLKKDYILIAYKGNDKLYLPVENIDKLFKYSSSEGAKPTIHRLNSKEWAKTKLKIKSKIKSIREELIKIYKEREKSYIEPFKEDNEMQVAFEKEFIYEETLDQIKSIREIKEDLESGKPMDRLLCGDVGYGKTEVIFRAIFKAVMNKKQVVYLCPTTILSHQQYYAALERFKNYPINIEIINRHKTKKEIIEIVERLKANKIDIVFGTHRLLSKDIEFGNLGLLIIDEEHKFGVEHKEKIKKLKSNVHVLSVSATPIPRSLQMSLIGIRNLSLIDTPPKNRYPVSTYVINYDEMLIREVVLNELSRKGQVFILYNKIYNIDAIQKKYSNLIPEAKIKYIHGKMNKEYIQDILLEFINNEFDVLISTTIIENGIDIPNANSMIIIDANNFGLSQLYQIRGRVGRSDKIAYAYLMYDKSKILTSEAIKRLEAIKEFTELGSGYKISMRDLAIRGAGDILGKEQAGFIDSVGIDMYLELIKDEDEVEEENLINIDDVETHIDKNYSDEDEIIIDIHKKIKSINSKKEINLLQKEISDRFGNIDDKLILYMHQTYLEKLLNDSNIKIFLNNNLKITIKLNEEIINKLNIEKLFTKSININNKFKFIYKNNYLLISLNKNNIEKNYIYYFIELLEYIKDILK